MMGMPLMPVMLDLSDRTAVIIGGGRVALRRAGSLLAAGARVKVIAPQIDPGLAALDVQVEERAYADGDLDGADLTIIATDAAAANTAAAQEAKRRGIWVNRADEPDEGNVIVPAHRSDGPITVAVHTGGTGPRIAARMRDQMLGALDPDWRRLIEIVEPYRHEARRTIDDPQRRRNVLERITGDDAMATLKNEGTEALESFCREALTTHAGE